MLTPEDLKLDREIAENWPKYAKSEVEPDTMILRLVEEVERLRFVLAFYAEPHHWNEDGVCETEVGPGITEQDEGWTAREALGMDPRHPRRIPDEEGAA